MIAVPRIEVEPCAKESPMAEMETRVQRGHDRPVSDARELSGATATPADAVIAAQRAVGNQAVQHELHAGSPGLALEQQAAVGNQRVQRLLRRRLDPAARRRVAAGALFAPTRIARQATIQRSPLSQDVERIWRTRQDKGDIFDRLRAGTPAPADAELTAVLTRIFSAGSDDLWLARQIQQHGAEPLWPAALIEQRGRRAREHRWADEPGHIQATLATSAGGRPINAYFFPGRTDERALIISGVHGSELSAIQVAEQLLAALRTGPRPYNTVIVVPRLFPDNAALAESRPSAIGTRANVGRDTDRDNPTNRQYPEFGRAFDPADPVDDRGQRMELETIALLTLVDRFRPSRIASLHATHHLENAGIYADPRTNAEGRALGFDDDRRLALAIAGHARRGGANLPGNELDARSPNAIYPRDPAAVPAGERQPRNVEGGVSGGGWFATEVRDPDHPARNRPAMTMITVEVQSSRRVEDVAAGEQAARQREIEAHASALREIFLGPPP
jgi:hypothetical protein